MSADPCCVDICLAVAVIIHFDERAFLSSSDLKLTDSGAYTVKFFCFLM